MLRPYGVESVTNGGRYLGRSSTRLRQQVWYYLVVAKLELKLKRKNKSKRKSHSYSIQVNTVVDAMWHVHRVSVVRSQPSWSLKDCSSNYERKTSSWPTSNSRLWRQRTNSTTCGTLWTACRSAHVYGCVCILHSRLNPFNGRAVIWFHLATQVSRAFLISDIRALWRSALSARVPECQKLKM